MATIEERARSLFPTDGSDVAINRMNAYKRLGYLRGATEQRAIDIDKAVAWLKANKLRDDIIKYYYDTQRDELSDGFIDEFRKAMLEQ